MARGRHFADHHPGSPRQGRGGTAMPRILELSSEGLGPRTEPGTRGERRGHDGTGANTDGKHAVCGATAPHQPTPGPSLTPESSAAGWRVSGSRVNSGRRGAGAGGTLRVNPDETAVGKDFVSPGPGSFQRLFFSFLIPPRFHWPLKWVIMACTLQRRRRNA